MNVHELVIKNDKRARLLTGIVQT